LRRRPPKSALREQSHGDAQNLQAALFAGHARAIRRGTICRYFLLASQTIYEEGLVEVSTHLPCWAAISQATEESTKEPPARRQKVGSVTAGYQILSGTIRSHSHLALAK